MDERVMQAAVELESLVRRLRGVDRRSVPAEVVRALGLLHGVVENELDVIFCPVSESDEWGGEGCDND